FATTKTPLASQRKESRGLPWGRCPAVRLPSSSLPARGQPNSFLTVGAKRTRRNGAEAEEISLASIRGYIAAQSRRARDSCPHADGPLRIAWLESYESGIRAMAEWGGRTRRTPRPHRRLPHKLETYYSSTQRYIASHRINRIRLITVLTVK